MEYSEQDQLGRFGARWGCLGAVLLNIAESELNRPLEGSEVEQIIGRWFLTESVLMANYKHDSHLGQKNEPDGWDEIANPEWHFLVVERAQAIDDVKDVLGIYTFVHSYEILELSTIFGSHFVLRVDGRDLINPDPRIHGPILSIQEVE